MNVKFRKRFLKELAKIPSQIRLQIEHFVFEEIPQSHSLYESGKFEKMHGYDRYYKIRFGPYRIGVKVENDIVIFERILHRKEIYRYFP